MERMTTGAVIVAAGRGLRAGGGQPKQWRTVAGRAVAAWTLDAFRTSPLIEPIALVLHPDDMGLAPGYRGHPDVVVAEGGATRDGSVRAGLEALAGAPPDFVLIHDVARPLVSHDLIARIVDAVAATGAAAPALAVTDALWRGAGGSPAPSTEPASGGPRRRRASVSTRSSRRTGRTRAARRTTSRSRARRGWTSPSFRGMNGT